MDTFFYLIFLFFFYFIGLRWTLYSCASFSYINVLPRVVTRSIVSWSATSLVVSSGHRGSWTMKFLFFALFVITIVQASTNKNDKKRDAYPFGEHRTFEREKLAISSRIRTTESSFIFHLLKHKFKHPLVEKVPTPETPSNCICVPFYQCDANNTIITDGLGLIDPRSV